MVFIIDLIRYDTDKNDTAKTKLFTAKYFEIDNVFGKLKEMAVIWKVGYVIFLYYSLLSITLLILTYIFLILRVVNFRQSKVNDYDCLIQVKS
jgi:hypothetical protein